ncbi:MAG: ATP-binding protein [Oscillospiraceae bacterium]|nr:ATP-binding protein [Oscillospiraceae bacterium]
MPYEGKLLGRARAQLEARRMANMAEQQRRTIQVYSRVPEIRQIDDTLRAQMAEVVRLTIARKPDLVQQLEALAKSNQDLQMRRVELLVENSFPQDYLDEIVSCPKCRDTGELDGGICDCLLVLYNQELTKELGVLLQTGDESFSRFDLGLYSDEPVVGGLSPRRHMARILEICRKFADNFPQVSSDLLFRGAPGLGKTYLSACIARVVADKGCSVCYDTASAALDAFERQKFARDPGEAEEAARRVRQMLSCDLMILDDLGTEMVTPMSLSALYTLLNTRMLHDRRTIISTNCSEEDLRRRYTPQICSRLEGEFLLLPFVGEDIRKILRQRR